MIEDCNGCKIYFDSFSEGNNILYKSTRNILLNDLKIPMRYLLNEASAAGGVNVEQLFVRVIPKNRQHVQLCVTNKKGIIQQTEFTYFDIFTAFDANIPHQSSSSNKTTSFSDDEDDDDGYEGLGIVNQNYMIKETLLIYHNNDCVLTVAFTEVKGIWNLFIRLYRFTRTLLKFLLLKFSSFTVALAILAYFTFIIVSLCTGNERVIETVNQQLLSTFYPLEFFFSRNEDILDNATVTAANSTISSVSPKKTWTGD